MNPKLALQIVPWFWPLIKGQHARPFASRLETQPKDSNA